MRRRDGWRAPYDFTAARPTFVDAWPQAWHALAPETEIVFLDETEARAIGAQITGFGSWFAPVSPQPLVDLTRRIDRAVARQNRASFVRLTSRSPKDSPRAQRDGMCVRGGSHALALLMDGSERCAADLRMALDTGETLGIVVRRWLEIAPWTEFRCFMAGGRWIGISQARHRYDAAFPSIPSQIAEILAALRRSMTQIIAVSPVADGAFDLVFPADGGDSASSRAVLLDVNPLLEVTDLALFADREDLDGTFRYRGSCGSVIGLPL